MAEPGANLTNVIQKTGSPNSINIMQTTGGQVQRKSRDKCPICSHFVLSNSLRGCYLSIVMLTDSVILHFLYIASGSSNSNG